MKKIKLSILFSFILATSLCNAQIRKRTTPVFNADTTKPAPGFYGISVKDGQPYLMDSEGIHNRIEISPRFIAARSYGVSNKNITLSTTQERFIYICGDSVTVDLPNAELLKDDSVTYTITFLGFPTHATTITMFDRPPDSTARLVFPDTIRAYNAANGTTYISTILSHDSNYAWYRIKPNDQFQIFVWKQKWYIRRDLSRIRF